MSSRTQSAVVLAVASFAALFACGGSGKPVSGPSAKVVTSNPTVGPASSPSPTPTPSAEVTATPSAVSGAASIKAMMTHLTSTDPVVIARGAAYTMPGSPAALYVAYRAGVTATLNANGITAPAATASPQFTGTYRLCVQLSAGAASCTLFTKFDVSPAGKVVSFYTQGAIITRRLVTPGATATAGGLTATLSSAYISGEGESTLLVLFTLANASGGDQNITTSQFTYQGPAGIALKPTSGDGPTSLRAGAKGLYEMSFPNASAGGTLFITYASSDYSSTGSIALKVG